MTTAIAKLNVVREALDRARTLSDVKQLRDQAAVIRNYIRQQNFGREQMNACAEFKLDCERKMGRMLKEMGVSRHRPLRDETTGELRGAEPTLPEGITPIQSHRYQREAAVPDAEYAAWVERTTTEDGELTTKGLLALAHRFVQRETLRVVSGQEELELAPGGLEEDEAGYDAEDIHDRHQAVSHIEVVQLILTSDTKPIFLVRCRALGQVYGTDNVTDTVWACVAQAHASQAAPEGRDAE